MTETFSTARQRTLLERLCVGVFVRKAVSGPTMRRQHIFVLPPILFHVVLWPIARFILWFIFKLKIHGEKNLQELNSGKVIFALNHTSEADPVVFQYALPFFCKFVPLYFVSLTKEYYRFNNYGIRSFFYGGLFFKLMGAYPAYRGLSNYEIALQHQIEILEHGHAVCIFPEGKMNKSGSMKSIKPGIIYLANKTNTPVMPVIIHGLADMRIKDVLCGRARITVSFAKQIYPREIDCHNQRNEVDLDLINLKIPTLLERFHSLGM